MTDQERELDYYPISVSTPHENLGPVDHTGYVMKINGVDQVLHWGNTAVHTFEDPQYNHIRVIAWRVKEIWRFRRVVAELCAIAIEDEALELADKLLEANFPHHYLPLPDPETFEWWIGFQAMLGAAATNSFLRQQPRPDGESGG